MTVPRSQRKGDAMKKVSRVIIGGTLIALGCGCFLYPNFREWNTQREVESDEEFCEKADE